jgi:hypothetical protein
MTDNARTWHADLLKGFVGKTIKEVRGFTGQEIEEFAWEHVDAGQAVLITFTDGSTWIPSADPEGNGPGFIFTEG